MHSNFRYLHIYVLHREFYVRDLNITQSECHYANLCSFSFDSHLRDDVAI
jgi:hypothetical protein